MSALLDRIFAGGEMSEHIEEENLLALIGYAKSLEDAAMICIKAGEAGIAVPIGLLREAMSEAV